MFRRGCLQGGGRSSLILLVLQETLALARLPRELVDVKRLRQGTCRILVWWLAMVFHLGCWYVALGAFWLQHRTELVQRTHILEKIGAQEAHADLHLAVVVL